MLIGQDLSIYDYMILLMINVKIEKKYSSLRIKRQTIFWTAKHQMILTTLH